MKFILGKQTKYLGYYVLFILPQTAAIRLARFNSKSQAAGPQKYFIGLASPAAAANLITFIWMIEVSTTTADNSKWIGLIALPVLSFLMIIIHYIL